MKFNIAQETIPTSYYIRARRRSWRLIQATIFRFSPIVMRGWRRFLLQFFGAKLHSTSSVHNTARIDCPWNLIMGDSDYVCVGQFCRLITGSHNYNDPTFPLVTAPIIVKKGSWLSVGVTVLPKVTIGENCVIGCSSLVNKDMPDGFVCAGVPCKPIKRREGLGVYSG